MTSPFVPSDEEMEFARSSMPITPQRQSISVKQSRFAPTEDEMAFADASMTEPLSEEIPWYKSFPSAFGKGLIKGTIALGEAFGGLPRTPEQKEEGKIQRGETLEKILPSEEGRIESTLERAGKLIPEGGMAIATGGGSLLGAGARLGGAIALGETAKELGFGETIQELAETGPYLLPSLGKKILPTKLQAPVVKEARRLGLSEKEIAPLIQSEKKQKILGKFSLRGENTQEILKGSKKAIGNIYDTLGASDAGKNAISKEAYDKLSNGFTKLFEKIPADEIKKIRPDLNLMLEGEVTGEKLMNFYQKLNSYIKKGNPQLGLLKNPLLQAMEKVSPEFSKDFQIAQNLYAKSAQIRKTLSPKNESLISKWLNNTLPYRLAAGMYTGYMPLLVETLGEHAARKFGTLMLTNPRYQNITRQMVDAASKNQTKLAMNFRDVLKNQLEDEMPEVASMMDYIDFTNQPTKD